MTGRRFCNNCFAYGIFMVINFPLTRFYFRKPTAPFKTLGKKIFNTKNTAVYAV